MEIDRKAFLESLGDANAVGQMDSEARADALEHRMMAELNSAIASKQGGGNQAPNRNEPIIDGPPISMFSIACSIDTSGRATVSRKG